MIWTKPLSDPSQNLLPKLVGDWRANLGKVVATILAIGPTKRSEAHPKGMVRCHGVTIMDPKAVEQIMLGFIRIINDFGPANSFRVQG